MTTNDAAKRYCDYPCPFTEEGHANGMAGHTYEPSNPSTNDDADRLRGWFEIPFVGPEANEMLDAALAAERRATVERIRASVLEYGVVDVPIRRLLAILDAERDR